MLFAKAEHNNTATEVVKKRPPPFFCVQNHESFGFSRFEPKKWLRVLKPRGRMGPSGTSAIAPYVLFSHFCYVGNFCDLGDPVLLPTLRGASRDVVIVYAY